MKGRFTWLLLSSLGGGCYINEVHTLTAVQYKGVWSSSTMHMVGIRALQIEALFNKFLMRSLLALCKDLAEVVKQFVRFAF
mmetsp:Transcript_30151/g.66859  ORF Transcript_30151/g.66859 Transcript_30151/m.66859 type:complete len:81 (+) Transcript_30151:1395-1637(+)